MNLYYDPTEFERDFRYLTKNNKTDIQNYQNYRFKNATEKMNPILQFLTNAFITNIANVFSNGVNYGGYEEENSEMPEWIIDDMIPEKVKWEQYRRLNLQSLLYTYKVKNELKFKAFPASRYFIIYDDNTGNMDSVIVLTGWGYKRDSVENGEVIYYFKKWENGQVLRQNIEATKDNSTYSQEIWDLLDDGQWVQDLIYVEGDQIEASYKTLPFVLLKEDNTVIPVKSSLPDLENETVTGDAYAILNLTISMIQKMVAIGSISPTEFDEFSQKFGNLFSFAKLPDGTEFKPVEQGDTQNIMNYKDYFIKMMRTILQLEGGDPYAFFPDIKVESGKSRELQMKNIEMVRKKYISEYRKAEKKHWEIIVELRPDLKKPDYIKFNNLDIGLSELDKEDLKTKKADNFIKIFQNDAITKEELAFNLRKIFDLEQRDFEDIQKEKMQNIERIEGDYDNNEDVDELQQESTEEDQEN